MRGREREGAAISFRDLTVWHKHPSQCVYEGTCIFLSCVHFCVCVYRGFGRLLMVSAVPIMKEKAVKYEVLII